MWMWDGFVLRVAMAGLLFSGMKSEEFANKLFATNKLLSADPRRDEWYVGEPPDKRCLSPRFAERGNPSKSRGPNSAKEFARWC